MSAAASSATWLELVDSPRRPGAVVLKLDLATEDRKDAMSAVAALLAELGDAVQARAAVVGVSARFFRGPMCSERDLPGTPMRFRIAQPAPRCLRGLRVRGDERWPAVATADRIAAHESDLFVLAEGKDPAEPGWAERFAGIPGLIVRDAVPCFHPQDGRTALGHVDGLSNLQDLKIADPEGYRRHLFVGTRNGEHPAYAGGTYLVYRRYRLHLDAWHSVDFSVSGRDGVSHRGQAARDRVVGRTVGSGEMVIERSIPSLGGSGEPAPAVPESHVRHANPRGRAETKFGTPVVPRDVRILRRSYRVADSDRQGTEDLAFLCFQADIQRGGFEYINNEWLMAGGFLGHRDALMDPANGVVEPIDGCYYFVPREPDPGLLFG